MKDRKKTVKDENAPKDPGRQNAGQLYLLKLRDNSPLSTREQLSMIWQLSFPAILAQISSVAMQYIDASMVGQLGAAPSAAIGLIASTTWLIGGLLNAAALGWSVQVAHRIGAREDRSARSLVRHGLVTTLLLSILVLALCLMISAGLPRWLGGDRNVAAESTRYFRIYALALPFLEIIDIAGSMLQNSGDMKIPSAINILMCVLNVIFNFLLIFPARTVRLGESRIRVPGMNMGVAGAAGGTLLSELVCAALMLYFLLFCSKSLHLSREELFACRNERQISASAETDRKQKPAASCIAPYGQELANALKIAVPLAMETTSQAGAQVIATTIVAPLGTISIAANSFAVTAESLCYMPGYGIGAAATSLVGQSIGAKRNDMTRRLSWMTVVSGAVLQTGAGVLMYIFAPQMMGILSPDPAIRSLGAEMLRIEAFAEPMFAASIVCSGVFRGMADTLVPSILNFISMWGVRLPLASVLSKSIGLRGVWIAMLTELCVRGTLYMSCLAVKTRRLRRENMKSM